MVIHRANVDLPATRRQFLQGGLQLGTVALATLLAGESSGAAGRRQVLANPLTPRKPHFLPSAKSVIQLFMTGGPSHLDMFD